MNPFYQPDLTRFYADLNSAMEAAPSPEQKVRTAVARLDLFLDARSYGNVTKQNRSKKHVLPGYSVPIYDVPYQVFVRIQPDRNELLSSFGRRPSMEKAEGPEFRQKIDDDYTLVVEGAARLFEKEPFLKDLCIHFAKHLATSLSQLNPSGRPDSGLDGLNGKTAKAALLLDESISSFLDWSPIVQAFKLLGEAVEYCNVGQSQLRRVWVSRSFNPDSSFPYIYMQEADSDSMPEPLNKNGSEGIIHGVLTRKTPELIWNYIYSQKWKHPDETKGKFIKQANPAEYPHMIYFPVMERLAAQITFGPNDDLVKLLNAGHQLAELAPLMLLYGFQEVIYSSLLDLLWHCHLEKGTSGMHESMDFLKFIADSCPIPSINVIEHNSGLLEIRPVNEGCQMAKAFAEHTNSAIKHAQETALKMSETEDYKIFAANVMGMTHTLERPLDNMKSYVQSVAAQKKLSKHLTERSSAMLAFLDGIKVFAKLEVEAFKDAFPLEDKPAAQFNCTADDILAVLSRVGYDPASLNYKNKGHFPKTLLLSDPIRHKRILVKRNAKGKYPAASGPLALIIAELIDNAVKHSIPYDTPVELFFNQTKITIVNSIDDPAEVEDRLNEGCNILVKSLGRIFHVAKMIKFKITPTFPSPTRLEIQITTR